jgi:tetratricopeptide (TPR) repeat protein
MAVVSWQARAQAQAAAIAQTAMREHAGNERVLQAAQKLTKILAADKARRLALANSGAATTTHPREAEQQIEEEEEEEDAAASAVQHRDGLGQLKVLGKFAIPLAVHEGHFEHALDHFNAERWSDARNAFNAALKEGDSRAARCHCGIGLCYSCEGGSLETALECFDRALAIDPTNKSVLHNRAQVMFAHSRAQVLSELGHRGSESQQDQEEQEEQEAVHHRHHLQSDHVGLKTIGLFTMPLIVHEGTFELALDYFARERWSDARDAFEAALREGDARVARCHNGVGLCYSCEGAIHPVRKQRSF